MKCWHFAGIAHRLTAARGVLVGSGDPPPVRKYYFLSFFARPLDSPEQCCGVCRPTFVDKESA
jgi:hypothetical protein